MDAQNQPPKGRGAAENITSRFASTRVDFLEPMETNPDTKVTDVRIEKVLTSNNSPDVPFELSTNPYQGCEHGCVYCYARPSHAYFDLSPGLDFETQILARTNSVERLRVALGRPTYRCLPIAIGANTDAYQPAERNREITRGILELMLECRQPAVIITKSALIERDTDLLAALAERNLVHVMISVTTLDDDLKRRLEPRAAAPGRRIKTIEHLTASGIPTGTMIAPVIPGLTDHELESIVEVASQAGAQSAAYVLLRLPNEVRPLFEQWLRNHFPLRAGKVLSLIRQVRGGRMNDPRFGHRITGSGPWADLLQRRFDRVLRKHALGERFRARLDTQSFRPPAAAGQIQMDL